MNNQQIKANVCKYPKEVYSALTSSKTFSVRGELVAADANKNQSPYKVYDGVFSRFVFTIIQKAKGKPTTFPDANISVNEIPGLIEASKAAKSADTFLSLPVIGQIFNLLKETTKLTQRVGDAINTIYFMIKGVEPPIQQQQQNLDNLGKLAKSVVIANGNYKGKTPFEILVENPDEASGLEKQYNWLSQNVAKYPKNQEQMDAIAEALDLLNRGLLQSVSEDPTNSSRLNLGDVVLYEALPKALIRKKDQQGLCPVYEIGVIWHMNDRYQVEVIISNYKAPVTRSNTGTINPNRQKAQNYVRNSFRLTSSQWFECLYNMQTHMRRFEDLNAQIQFEQADHADRANREATQQQNQAQQNNANQQMPPQGQYQQPNNGNYNNYNNYNNQQQQQNDYPGYNNY